MKTETPSDLSIFWENHVNTWKESNLSQAAYCLEHELQVHRFGYWKRKLINTKMPSSQEQGFIQLSPINNHPISYSPVPTLAGLLQ